MNINYLLAQLCHREPGNPVAISASLCSYFPFSVRSFHVGSLASLSGYEPRFLCGDSEGCVGESGVFEDEPMTHKLASSDDYIVALPEAEERGVAFYEYLL